MWDLSSPIRDQPSSLALRGGFLTTWPSQGSPMACILEHQETMGRFEYWIQVRFKFYNPSFYGTQNGLRGEVGQKEWKEAIADEWARSVVDLPESARFRAWSPVPAPSRRALGPSFLFSPSCLLITFLAIVFLFVFTRLSGLPGSLDGKQSTCNAGDLGLIPGSGRSPGEGNDNPLQYFCLGNTMDKRTLGRLQPMELQRIRRDLAFQQQQGYRVGTLLPVSLYA